MGIFKFRKSEPTPAPQNTPNDVSVKYSAFGVPIVKIGKEDITKPYINTGYYIKDYVKFGYDNLFPSVLDNLYWQSPLHSGIIDYQINTTIGGGYEIKLKGKTPGDKVREKTWSRQVKLRKLIKGIAYDLKIHSRVHILVHKNDKGEVTKIERLLPASVRYNMGIDKFWVSHNWLGTTQAEVIPAYSIGSKDKLSIWSYIELEGSPGQDVYPLPSYMSANNWIFLDGESANLQKKNIQRSIFGQLVIRRPKDFKTSKEWNDFKRGIENKEGEVLSAMVLTGEGMENVPEIQSFPVNSNDQAFANLYGRIDDKISQAHSINKILMGIQDSGKLGSGSDILASAPIWWNNVVVPFKETIEDIINDLMMMSNIDGRFELNENKLYDEELLKEASPGMGNTNGVINPEEQFQKNNVKK